MALLDKPETFVSIQSAAFRLGVPQAWLKKKVVAGEISHLRVGRRRLVNADAVERVLLRMSDKAAARTEGGT